MAQVFNPKEDGWSESVNVVLADDIDGYAINPETQLKEAGQVNHFSVFIGDVVKALSASDASVAAFLSAKTHAQKVTLVPMLLANAELKFTREHNEAEKKYITELLEIKVAENIKILIDKALADLFGF